MDILFSADGITVTRTLLRVDNATHAISAISGVSIVAEKTPRKSDWWVLCVCGVAFGLWASVAFLYALFANLDGEADWARYISPAVAFAIGYPLYKAGMRRRGDTTTGQHLLILRTAAGDLHVATSKSMVLLSDAKDAIETAISTQ